MDAEVVNFDKFYSNSSLNNCKWLYTKHYGRIRSPDNAVSVTKAQKEIKYLLSTYQTS